MLDQRLEEVREKYSKIFAIVSPPRCSSTAMARMFWEQPEIRYYSHEPFETVYYEGDGLEAPIQKLLAPLDLAGLYKPATGGQALVIKEMVYQVGGYFDALATLATAPVVFLVRDPRLNVSSRIRKKIEGGASPRFPQVETGWELLAQQVGRCVELGIPHVIVDASDFRDHPLQVFPRLFQALRLPFSPEMLRWRSGAHLDLDNLGGPHRHLYQRVLRSRALEPATEPVPSVESLSRDPAFGSHLRRCLTLYRALLASPARIQPGISETTAADPEIWPTGA